MASISPATPWQTHSLTTTNRTTHLTITQSLQINPKRFQSFTVNSTPPPLVVVGSANADIYVEIDRLPTQGETISATNGQTLAGGKGANQAAARSAGVPVILDAGGMDAPIPVELLKHVDILSPNESELARLTGMPTESFEQISLAVAECHKLGVKEVLVKLGARGSVLFTEGKEPIKQGIIEAEKVLDTTGAGDTFTAAYAVAFVEGKSKAECLRFAAAAASLCVQVKGAIPSMPRRKAVLDLLQSL
ncbi:hypothetical protein M8C21_011909 [Ambrosia artemisiifolia]|uniref:Carbohydrate kinase PfkB domain-containing protein n=1 Tax=Ambrosia artemisiifolia TaxID=4212 RepID=A0AAD5GNQ1_AMBAR|nr:hypothetical protein M8C21_011909 [Ambrosia artemisiifolia]